MISITLPCNRPEALHRTLANIQDTMRGWVEVIVCSPFPFGNMVLHNGMVIHVFDEHEAGCNAGHMMAASYATGDYITAWVDDHLYVDGWDELIIKNFERFGTTCQPLCLGLKHANRRQFGTVFGKYYPYFPFMRRSDLGRVGGWISGDYKSGFADCDLAMRVWAAGGYCTSSVDDLVLVHEDDNRKGQSVNCHPQDMELFVQRWKPRFGRGWDTSHLRGFNVDVRQ